MDQIDIISQNGHPFVNQTKIVSKLVDYFNYRIASCSNIHFLTAALAYCQGFESSISSCAVDERRCHGLRPREDLAFDLLLGLFLGFFHNHLYSLNSDIDLGPVSLYVLNHRL